MKNLMMESRSMATLLLLLTVGLRRRSLRPARALRGHPGGQQRKPPGGPGEHQRAQYRLAKQRRIRAVRASHRPYVIGASAAGHVPSTEVYVGPARGTLRLRLTPAETSSFNPAQPLDKEDSLGTRLQVPAGSLVDASGRPPSGPLLLSMRTYALANEPLLGDMTGLDSAGQRAAVRSLGAVSVEFTDASGNRYNLAPGRQATLSWKMPASNTFAGPVPLWWFDTQQGLWREEGTALVQGERATGQVTHFTVWSAGAKFTDPACIQLRVDATWFASQGYSSRNPLRVQAQVIAPSPRVIQLDITGVDEHVLYNLEPNSLVRFTIRGNPYDVVSSRGAWGGASGYPAYPYDACRNSVLFDGTQRYAAIQGQVKLQHRAGHGDLLRVQLQIGNTFLFAAPDADGNFWQEVPAGTYVVSTLMPGYLSAQRGSVPLQPGVTTTLPLVTLLAGDTNASQCVDVADMRAINDAIPSDVEIDDPRDMDGDGKVTFQDLRQAAGNGRLCGPASW